MRSGLEAGSVGRGAALDTTSNTSILPLLEVRSVTLVLSQLAPHNS